MIRWKDLEGAVEDCIRELESEARVADDQYVAEVDQWAAEWTRERAQDDEEDDR